MKNKTLSLMIVSVLALVMALNFSSAAITYTETFESAEPGIPGSYANGSFVGDNEGITWTYVEACDEGDYAITGKGLMLRGYSEGEYESTIYSNVIPDGIGNFSVQLKKGYAGTGDRQVELYINNVLEGTSKAFDDNSTHTFIVNNINIEGNVKIEIRNIKNKQVVIDDISWTTYEEENNFCTEGCENYGNLTVTIDDVEDFDVTGFGDEDEWYLFDKVDVGVNVDNTGSYDIKKIKIEWELRAGTSTMEEGELNKFKLESGDDDDFTISLDLSDSELKKSLKKFEDKDVVLYVKATGEIDDEDHGIYDDQDTCAEDSVEVEVNTGDDFVILDGLDDLNTAQCKSEVHYTLHAWNIGDEDQENVSVEVYNRELGIDEIIKMGDIDAFKEADTPLEFSFKIPPEIEEKNYVLSFRVLDEDGRIFENDNDDDAAFTTVLKVQGNCYLGKAKLSAILQEGGKAGEPLVIKTTITNTGTKITTYSLVAKGFEGWASTVNMSQNNFALVPGESRDVLITLNVKKDVFGEKSFDIEAYSEQGKVLTQPVSVSIEKARWNLKDPFAKGNMTGFIILNIILVILIIFIAIKIARK